MALDLIGTPVALDFDGTNNTPASQNITVPSGCSHVVVFWQRQNAATWTLDGNAPDLEDATTGSAGSVECGFAVFESPATGSLPLQPTSTITAGNAGWFTTQVVFVQDGDAVGNWVSDLVTALSGGGSFTLSGMASGWLVLQSDSHWEDANAGPPATPSGWSSVVTQDRGTDNTAFAARVSEIAATGATQGCANETPFAFNTLVGLGIPPSTPPASDLDPITSIFPCAEYE